MEQLVRDHTTAPRKASSISLAPTASPFCRGPVGKVRAIQGTTVPASVSTPQLTTPSLLTFNKSLRWIFTESHSILAFLTYVIWPDTRLFTPLAVIFSTLKINLGVRLEIETNTIESRNGLTHR